MCECEIGKHPVAHHPIKDADIFEKGIFFGLVVVPCSFVIVWLSAFWGEEGEYEMIPSEIYGLVTWFGVGRVENGMS